MIRVIGTSNKIMLLYVVAMSFHAILSWSLKNIIIYNCLQR